ncbi:sigma-70 family RNA polymerase sigma factor [Paenibacillus sp. TAB 01]|uniref:sigma-70 family RNA polymerase sigma factor n=1 Tax=Paenibacillus sp. TAB 01 TaxID=3368988 RepID=UPI00375043FF
MIHLESAHPLGTADEIIRSYSRLVHYVAKRFRWALSPSLQYDDLVSEGMAGLLKAYKKFDESKGFKFTTIATSMIQWEIQKHLRDREQVMSVPRSLYVLAGEISRQKLIDESPSEIAKILSCTEKKVEEALRYLKLKIRSLDQPLPGQDDDKMTIRDTITHTDDISKIVTQDFLESLTEREQQLVQLRLAGVTQKDIGKSLRLSQVQISRIQAKIAEKLQHYMEVDNMSAAKITKDEYLELKSQNKSDPEIRLMFKIGEPTLTRLKKEWDVTGMRKVVQHKKSEGTKKPAAKEVAAAPLITHSSEPALVSETRSQPLRDELNIVKQIVERLERENELLRALLKNYL